MKLKPDDDYNQGPTDCLRVFFCFASGLLEFIGLAACFPHAFADCPNLRLSRSLPIFGTPVRPWNIKIPPFDFARDAFILSLLESLFF